MAISFFMQTPAKAIDNCEVYLCMAGKALGSSGGSACTKAEASFFSKIAFKASGGISLSKTAKVRKEMLGSCKGSDPTMIEKIIGMFGKII